MVVQLICISWERERRRGGGKREGRRRGGEEGERRGKEGRE